MRREVDLERKLSVRENDPLCWVNQFDGIELTQKIGGIRPFKFDRDEEFAERSDLFQFR